MLEILASPFATCLVLTGILCYFGIHVIMREVIFVDLALAQVAAMGAAVGALIGFDPHSVQGYVAALGFTLVGAAIFTLGRFRDARVPQEAIIGIVYAVSTAAALLIFSKIAVEQDEVENMLVGRLLFVDWAEVGRTAAICAAVGLVHFGFRRQFFEISTSFERARARGVNVYLWDFVFYGTFGFVVTSSVQAAGVLLVFSFLIVPAACAMMFFGTIRARLLVGWMLGVLASAAGLAASALWDLPTGASIVAVFGVLFACCAAVYAVVRPARTQA